MKSLPGHAAMLGANTMWGMMSPISKFIMMGGVVSPLIVTDLRIAGAAALFWFASLFQKPEHVPHGDMARLFGAALLGIVLNQGCFIFGVSLSSPADASIITTSMPLWAMVFAAFILKEPITGRKVLGIAAGASGALLLILGSGGASASATASAAGSHALWGDLLVLAAQCCYALYIVVYKDFVRRYSLVTIMKWMFTYSFLLLLPFSASSLMQCRWSALSAEAIGGLAFVVVGGTFLAYMLIVVGQQRLRPTVAGMYNYVQPLVACIIAVLWHMDTWGWTKTLAVALICGGVWLVTRSRSREELERFKAAQEQ